MRLSNYTMLIRHQKGLYVYNSLSNCLIKVDKELFDFMESVKDTSFSEKVISLLIPMNIKTRPIIKLKKVLIIPNIIIIKVFTFLG